MMDWCTFWPDSMFGISWAHCCAVHDIAYTLDFDKLQADLALKKCVANEGAAAMGAVMFVGVFLFGGFVKIINNQRIKHGKKTI